MDGLLQVCPLEIGSFGHNSDEITYHWSDDPLSMDISLELAQYLIVNWTHGEKYISVRNGDRSIVFLQFTFDRSVGFYLLQVYIPLTLIVMCSWVTFWLVRLSCPRILSPSSCSSKLIPVY